MRAIWSGSLIFGLIEIPVKLMPAVEETTIDLDLLSKDDLAPVRYARIDSQTGKELEWKDMVKGFQYVKGKYVVVEDADFAKAAPAKSKAIDISQFVQEQEIDPLYFEKPYYLIPAKGGAKPYSLLMKALEKTGAVGVAEWVMRNHQHVCCIKPFQGMLLLHQMRYAEHIKAVPASEAVQAQDLSNREIELAVQLVQQLSAPFEPTAYKDTYTRELKRIIKAKAAGKQVRIAEPERPLSATVKDLMAVLKESLGQPGKKRA